MDGWSLVILCVCVALVSFLAGGVGGCACAEKTATEKESDKLRRLRTTICNLRDRLRAQHNLLEVWRSAAENQNQVVGHFQMELQRIQKHCREQFDYNADLASLFQVFYDTRVRQQKEWEALTEDVNATARRKPDITKDDVEAVVSNDRWREYMEAVVSMNDELNAIVVDSGESAE